MWTLLLIYESYQDNFVFLKNHPSLPYYLIGFFLYNCSTVFIFPLWEYITNPNSSFSSLIPIHATFNIIMYLFISFGMYVENRNYLEIKNNE